MKQRLVGIGMGAVLLFGSLSLTACGGKEGCSVYTIVAEYFPEERTLSAEMTFDFYNGTETALDELKFELWANAYREGAAYAPVSELYAPSAYYNGKSYGGMDIHSVEGGAEYSVCGEDENILSVKLPSKCYPNERAKLKITYCVTLAEINHRLGVGEHTVNLANYYPVLCYYENGFQEYVYSHNGDPFVNECADYDVTLTLPEDYTAIFGGVGEEVAENGKKSYHVIAENVRDSAFVLGRNFECVTGEADGVEVSYYYFADPSPELALTTAVDSLKYFSKTFGKYAYPRYTVVETDFPYGGMEFAGLCMISSDLRASEIPSVVAHETAHQWWYAMVGSNQFERSWQDEGLAEYSTALFLDAHPAYGISYKSFLNSCLSAYRAYFAIYSQVSKEADTSMNRPLTSYTGEYEYRNLAYDKGVILFDEVREVTGDRKFFSALAHYFETCNGKLANYGDLVSCFGRSAEGVFDSFTQGLCVI